MTLTAKLWLALGIFLAGAALGGGGAWVAQGWRLDALHARFDGFVATTKAEGEAAKEAADKQAAADKLKKGKSDAENLQTRAALAIALNSLRAQRPAGSLLPPAPAGSSRPDLACYDRAELGRAYGDLVTEIRGFADEGSAAVIDLNTAKAWAAK